MLKKVMGPSVTKPLKQYLASPVQRLPLRPQFRAELADFFRADVQAISELLDRDLSHWVETPSVCSEIESLDRCPKSRFRRAG